MGNVDKTVVAAFLEEIAVVDSLSSVAVAISAFRSDDAVLRLLSKIFSRGTPPFAAIIVVDSLGSGCIEAAIRSNGWSVTYHNAERNLGSAGNLCLRLQLAARTGAKWCYAVNHDGDVDLDHVRRMLQYGDACERVGAVYPRLLFPKRGGALDAPRLTLAPHGEFRGNSAQPADALRVSWSSSNCALYCLEPVRAGVDVWADLWMGWEDLAYGWQLGNAGWSQILCGDVTIVDEYEFRPVRFLDRVTYISDKPVWYSYYMLRNLLIIARRSKGEAINRWDIARRGFVELIVILLYRSNKKKRLKLLVKGWRHGLAGHAGKGEVP